VIRGCSCPVVTSTLERQRLTRFLRFLVLSGALLAAAAAEDSQKSFETVVYIPVAGTLKMKDQQWLETSWAKISSQVHVDKVYLETYRSRVLADDQVIEDAKKFFAEHGVKVAGAICYSDSDNGQFVSFTYTKPADREYVKHVAEMTAKNFDEVILDDFFFANTKTPSDIAAKGNQSWTDFRLKTMDQVSRELVVEPARAVNPRVKITIKFPNWYEHFQGNGYDLEEQPKIFDAIYAGTETRDPVITDQNLQQYEGYSIVRYFENIAPGRNGGGWVDTYDITYLDRYSEQLWLTVFAKAKEMTLFNYLDLLTEPKPGERPWQDKATNVSWKKIVERGKGKPIFASVAGDALDQVKPFIDQLGKPIGVASYRPPHAVGEDFLHNFLGDDRDSDRALRLISERGSRDPADRVGEVGSECDCQREGAARGWKDRGDYFRAAARAGRQGHRRSGGIADHWNAGASEQFHRSIRAGGGHIVGKGQRADSVSANSFSNQRCVAGDSRHRRQQRLSHPADESVRERQALHLDDSR